MATITVSADKNIDDCVAPMWLTVATGGTVGSYVSLNPQSGTWTASVLPTSTTWNSVCYGKNMAVAVAGAAGAGNTTYAGYTYDGVTWFAATLPTSAHWKSVIFGNGVFVAIAYGGTATAYSSNGVNWTAGGALPSSANWEEVTYGEGTFVAVGGTTNGAYSTDNGVNWVASTMPTTTGYWSSVCYGTGKFVAVSYGAAHAATSLDGITWDTIRTMPSSANWKSVCYGDAIGGGLFMAVAYNSSSSATSADGITWGAVALSATANWQSVTYGVGNVATISSTSVTTPIFYARSYGATTTAYSTNGTSWTADTGVTGNITASCYCPSMRGDTLSIVDGATITVNTDQAPRFRYVNVTNGAFNITNTSTASGIRFPLVKNASGSTTDIITVYGLGEMNGTGNWIELGTGTGGASQTFNSWTNDVIPFVWVETGSGTGVYEKWGNITSQIDGAMYYGKQNLFQTVANGDAGKFFRQGLATEPAGGFPTGGITKDQFTAVLTFGDGTNGTVVPSGAKVKMPNIVLTDDTPIQLQNTGQAYHAYIDMQYSGSLDLDTCILSDFVVSGTQSKKLWLTSVGLATRPVLTKINNLIFTDVGLGEHPAYAIYNSGFRTNYDNRTLAVSPQNGATAQIWTYLNGAVFTDITVVHTITNGVGTTGLAWNQFQYCNDIIIDGFTVYQLNALWGQTVFYLDFVNTSSIKNLKIYGGGYLVSNCTETTVIGLEYLESFDNKNAYHGNTLAYWTGLNKDKSGSDWVDGTDYYFKVGLQRDSNYLYPIVQDGLEAHVKPFTPTLTSYPYYVGVIPGAARNDVYWSMTQYPRHNSPAIEVFWDTQAITAKAATTPIASPGVVTMTAHGFTADTGRAVVFSTSSALPTGITEGTTYYARPDTSLTEINEFWLYDTQAHADAGGATGRINFTGSTSGNHICTSGNRLTRSTSLSTATVAHTSLSNGTTYYYKIRAHESAGNILDSTCCDSPSIKGIPQAVRTFNNYCLQSRDLSVTATWVGTNVGTRTAASKHTSIQATVDGTRLVATGNATLVQTITGLTAGDYIFHFQGSDDGIGTSIDVNCTSGANSVTTTCALKYYPQLYQVAITVPGGSTTCAITFGAGTTWTNGEIITIGNCNFALASQQLTDITTTTTAVTGYTTDTLYRIFWDWKNRIVLSAPVNTNTTATNLRRTFNVLTQTTSTGSTPVIADAISIGISHVKHNYINNVSCTVSDVFSSSLATRCTPSNSSNAVAQLATFQNCANSTFTDFVFGGAAQYCARALQVALGCKNLLFANWSIPDFRGYAHDVSTTYGQPFTIANDNSGITFQNMNLGTKYTEGFYGFWGKNSIVKGTTGGNSVNSLVPGLANDSVQKDYTSVFDNSFFETFSDTTNGTLSLRFNDTELTTGSALSYSGSCGFDATGKWYAWDTDATLTMTFPYQLESTTGFRNITPQYFTTFWTSALNADRVLRPLALTVQYKINAGAWTDLTGANLNAETITAPFTFAIKFTVNRVVEYDGETGGGFAVGNTITGATSGATGVIEEILDMGTYGQLRISSYTLGGGTRPFENNENLQVSGTTRGVVNQGTTYSDNTFPNAGAYLSALDIYTTVDQSVVYPPYTGGTLALPTTVTDGGDYVVTAPATIEFQGTATPTLWDLSASTLTTTDFNPITLTNTSGAAITVAMDTGLNLINTGTGAAAITVTAPPINTGLDFSGVLTGSTVKVFETGTQTVIATLTSPAWEWVETYVADQTVDYTIQKVGYDPIRVTGVLCGNTVQVIPITQVVNRSYATSSGLTFGGTSATVNTGTKVFGLGSSVTSTTVQNWYSFMIESWITEATLQNVAFPLTNNGSSSFTLEDDWVWDGTTSINKLKQDGMRYVSSADVITDVWAAIYTPNTAAGLQVQYQQTDGGTTVNALNTGPMNQLVKIFENGVFDYTTYLVLKVQEDGYDQAEANVIDTYPTLEDNIYTVALNPLSNGLTTGDPGVTGVSITDHAGSPVTWNSKVFSITITDSVGGHTGEEIMRWLRYNYSLGGTFQSKDTFNWHDLVQLNGSSYKTVRGSIYGDTGAALKGVRVVQSDGSTAHADFNLFTADDGTTYAPPATLYVNLSGFVSGTRIQIYDTLTSSELFNDVVAATTKVYSEVYTVDRNIRVRASYVSGITAKMFTEQNLGTLTSTVTTVSRDLGQTDDTVYNLNGVDGSAVTDITFTDAATDIVNIDIATGATTWQDIYAAFAYWMFTSAGIADDIAYVTATDTANYRLTSMKIKNTSSPTVPLKITGGYGVDYTTGDSIDLIDTTGGTLFTAPNHVVPFSAGAAATEAIVQAGLTAQGYTATRGANLDKALTTGKFIALK